MRTDFSERTHCLQVPALYRFNGKLIKTRRDVGRHLKKWITKYIIVIKRNICKLLTLDVVAVDVDVDVDVDEELDEVDDDVLAVVA